MTNHVSDLFLSGITVPDVTRYLGITGWTRNSNFSNKNLLVFEKDVVGETVEVVLPSKTEYKDFRLRLGDLLKFLSDVDEVDVSTIVQQIRRPSIDRLQVRLISGISSEGSIPLSYASKLIQSMKDLFVAAACTEENPQPFYRRATKVAVNHADVCRFGQTRVGSYIVTIESPVPMTTQKTLFSHESSSPFSRRVVTRIQTGLAQVEQAVLDGKVDTLIDGYKTGINANMAEAILNLRDANQDAIFEYTMDLSPTIPSRISVPKVVSIEKHGLEFLEAAARALRGSDEEEHITITGKIIRLVADDVDEDESEELSGNRVIVIRSEESDFRRNVHVSLSADEYRIACDAHRDSRTVTVKGNMEYVGKIWQLMAPQDFVITP